MAKPDKLGGTKESTNNRVVGGFCRPLEAALFYLVVDPSEDLLLLQGTRRRADKISNPMFEVLRVDRTIVWVRNVKIVGIQETGFGILLAILLHIAQPT